MENCIGILMNCDAAEMTAHIGMVRAIHTRTPSRGIGMLLRISKKK